MKQYFRCLSFVILMVCSVQAFAFDEIDRFAKKCDLYSEPKSDLRLKVYLKKAKRTLDAANVPIRMSFKDCKSIKHIVQLKNGKEITLESGFATNENPDNKAESYTWNSNSPSKSYWRFDTSGWEWNGFVLINKVTGQSVTETSECHVNEMRMRSDLLAIVCEGAYENTFPSLYIVDLGKKAALWSEALLLNGCKENDAFVSSRFEFVSNHVLNIAGECQQRDYEYSKTKKVYFFRVKRRSEVKELAVTISSKGLNANGAGKAFGVKWSSKTPE